MDASESLHYPALALRGGSFYPFRNLGDATHCTAAALKAGFYRGLTIVDSEGKVVRIREARSTKHDGRIGVFDNLLNRRISVSLTAEGPPLRFPLEEVRKIVLKALGVDDDWSSRDDIAAIVSAVTNADSIREILGIVKSEYFRIFPI